MISFRPFLSTVCLVAFGIGRVVAQDGEKSEEPPPIQALMVTGGCCHDYETQKAILRAGISERVARRIEWTIVHQGQGESDVTIPLFEEEGWAEGYDIVVHNYCFTRVRDAAYVERVLAPHRTGKPAVLIHGTMHSFRTGNDSWFEFCGVTSRGHGAHQPLEIESTSSEVGILPRGESWTIPKGELYFVDQVWPGVEPLAESVSEETGAKEVVAWTHRYGPGEAKVFATTLGNYNETMIAPNYLDMIAKGFLWAVEGDLDEDFRGVASEDSLQSITLETPAPGLPTPGRNLVSDALSSSMPAGSDSNHAPAAALDGDVATLWRAERSGPAVWRCSLENSVGVGAVAMIWSEDPPPVYSVEGSNNLLDWHQLAEVVEGDRLAQIAVHEVEGDFTHFRISVAKTEPGQSVGLREFAVYEAPGSVPAALTLAANDARPGKRERQLLSVSSEEVPNGIELRDGFEWETTVPLPAGFRARQLVPTADGAVYVLATAEDKSSAVVVRIFRDREGRYESVNFLTRLDPETTIAWDGEWVYTLEGALLTAYRDTDRNGLADERYRLGSIFVRSSSDSDARVVFSSMRLAMDGRFYASVEATELVSVFAKEGPLIELPEQGIVSFIRTGEGLEVVLSSDTELGNLFEDRNGGLYFQYGRISGGATLSDIRKVVATADTGLGFSDAVSAKLLGLASDGFWVSDESQISVLSINGERDPVAVFPGLEMIEDSGLGSLWFSFRDAVNERECLGLLDIESETFASEDMDLQRQSDLIRLLESASPVIRREARYEVMRRRRFPQNQLVGVLSGSSDPDARVAAMAALNEAAGSVFLPHLVSLGRDPEWSVRAMAFRAMGRYDVAENHSVFEAITEEQNPDVTAEILGAIQRTGTNAPGIDALVLQFAASDDRVLSSSARAFLIDRESVDVCFAALDDPSEEDLWPVAFSILADMRRQSVVEGISLRLERTRSPKMRRLALATLTDIYYTDEAERATWEGTKIADLMLRASIADRRVDRAFLLARMLDRRIPVKDTVELVQLGRENLPLEPVVIELLLERETPIYAEDWLLEVVRDTDRDGDLRLNALALLGTIKSPPLLREIFPLLANRASFVSLPGTEEMAINRWLANPAHLANVDWMVGQAKNGDAEQGQLAWRTLLSVLDDPGLGADAIERVRSAMLEAAAGEEDEAMRLVGAMADSAYSGKEAILKVASKQGSVLVKNAALDLLEGSKETDTRSDDRIGGLEKGEILARIESIEGDPTLGKSVFSKLSCGDCHNIHGEGPALAPGLSNRAGSRSLEELAVAILHPEKSVVEGYAATSFELETGAEVLGHSESRTGTSITLLDTAGNRVDVPINAISAERESGRSIMRDDLTRDLTVFEFASLLRYVQSLAVE